MHHKEEGRRLMVLLSTSKADAFALKNVMNEWRIC